MIIYHWVLFVFLRIYRDILDENNYSEHVSLYFYIWGICFHYNPSAIYITKNAAKYLSGKIREVNLGICVPCKLASLHMYSATPFTFRKRSQTNKLLQLNAPPGAWIIQY
jgi:hypothetical protein